MNAIVMRGKELEMTTTHTFTFLTSNEEVDAINSATAVMELAEAMEVYYSQPIMLERNFLPRLSKWSVIVKGDFTGIGLFKEEAKKIVREW